MSSLSVAAVMNDGPVIPVIVIEELAQAVPMARALIAGGVRVLEVTLRTPVALQAIRLIADEVPEAIIGAGTLANVADLEAALKAGARFGVSPGSTVSLLRAARSAGLPLLPGVMTPGELMSALDEGYGALKFFPAVPAGGIAMLKALHGPFAQVRFCPTGGISPATAKDFLALPNVACIGGSWLTPAAAVKSGDWATVTRLASEAVALRP
ncbi:2-dehydro-3-deoxyphosphogluconate aldolase / (4S)-4-hydroxy-2-oxoglutarate aldolase [Solimonas aquatica]|uniref:2-dehydro-3-deoxy-phosphogluconate aldolase n=1 Tax=Solimonas aquatica TaxID=489703 RepID=A0A1H9AR27_9GAMM|nr:bifunctional 4-hydroxy-2-oxoglutarate aldolase/2-dehydro-3-deoxy-phosphogluconate aldolase [Solimonas aquatica]SEP79099.1 2-dehydro-3-deoxyphosphogluconate aldolase / (4S)-4-hydroxy-2-oxoglutarate aldolase [Solimonas aquatica]